MLSSIFELIQEQGTEIGLIVIFFVGFAVFRAPQLQQFFKKKSEGEKLLEKQVEADYTAGKYEAVIEGAQALACPSASVLHVAVAALLETSAHAAIPGLFADLRAKNTKLTLRPVLEQVFAAAELTAEKLDEVVSALGGSGSLAQQHVKALKARGVPAAELKQRFGADADAVLAEAKPPVDHSGSNSRVKAVGKQLDKTCPPEKALALVGSLPAHKRTGFIVNRAMAACAYNRDFACLERVWALVEEAEHDLVGYNTMLKARPQKAKELLAAMQQHGVQRSAVTYNTLLAVAVREHRPAVREWLDAMAADGIAPDSYTITIVLRAVVGPNSGALLKTLVDKLEASAALCLDQGALDALFAACGKVRSPELLRRALRVLGSQGCGIPLCAYVAALRVCAEDLNEARQVWAEMQSRAKEPLTDQCYSSMLAVYCQHGCLEDAVQLFEEAKAQCPDVGPSMYMVLVKAFAQRKELARALFVYREVEEKLLSKGEPVPKVLFNSLLDACARVGDMQQAEALWNDMPRLGVEPDLISFSTLIKGYCVKGDLENALAHFTQLRRRGLKADAVVYHSVLDGCAQQQVVALGEHVFRDMQNDGVAASNCTLSILIKLFGRSDLDRCFQLVEELPRQHGFAPNVQVYTCLISAALAQQDAPRALRVAQQAKRSGLKLDQHALQTLLAGCLKLGQLEAAAEVAQDARRAQVELPARILADLVFMLERRGRQDLVRLVEA